MALADIGMALGNGIANAASYSARAASRANGVSAAAQSAQGAFNQGSANLANSLGTDRIAEQYQFNAAQAAAANAFTNQMWDKSAAWNEDMFDRMAEFNATEAQKNRDWQERMMSTAYQRAVKDMHAAGLNPILAVTGGGISTGSGGGSAASVASPSMSGASGQAASGGLLQGLSASEGNYSGQMEYMGGLLGLFSAGISGLSSALKNFGSLGDFGAAMAEGLAGVLDKDMNFNFNFPDGSDKKGSQKTESHYNYKGHDVDLSYYNNVAYNGIWNTMKRFLSNRLNK